MKNDYHNIESFADLGVKKKNYVHIIATGHGGASAVLASGRPPPSTGGTKGQPPGPPPGGGGWATVLVEESRKDVKVKDLERNIVQSAIARSPFFTCASLKRYFPHLVSMQEFIALDDYLGGLEITFQGNLYRLDENKAEKLAATIGLLNRIEAEIRQQITEYQGSKDFRREWVREVFKVSILTPPEGRVLLSAYSEDPCY